MTIEPPNGTPEVTRVTYRNARAATVLYAIEQARAAELLKDSGLIAVGWRGYGLLHVAWFDYPESSIGPYRELSIGVLASAAPLTTSALLPLVMGMAGPIGSYVVTLPVDSSVACAGGIELYGLPKSLAEFELRWSKHNLTAKLAESGTTVLSMQLPLNFGVPLPIRQLKLFSRREGQLVTTTVSIQWIAWLDLVGRPRVTLGGGGTRLGRLMAEFELERARTVGLIHGQIRSAELGPPSDLPVHLVRPASSKR